MYNEYVLVIDAGTSAIRCSAIDQNGNISFQNQAAWPYLNSADSPTYAKEFDTKKVWVIICELLYKTSNRIASSKGKIIAVTATSQRQGIVFLDSNNSEIYSGPNHDCRAVFEGAEIDETIGEQIYKITGHTPSMLFAPAKLRWMHKNRPDSFSNPVNTLCLADWIIYRLSGELISEYSLASGAGLLDIHNQDWNAIKLDGTPLVDNTNVTLIRAGTSVGIVQKLVSATTGIPVGTPVVVSGADTQCGLLGMSTVNEKEVGIIAGWSAPIQMITHTPKLSESQSTWAGCFLTPDTWVAESSATDTGNSYKWLSQTILASHNESFEEMDMLASDIPVGSEGTMTFFGKPEMNVSNLGFKSGGILFPTPVSFGGTERGHIVRSALESIAYAIRANLEQLQRVSGFQTPQISIGGGMTTSNLLTEIIVNVLGRPVKISSNPNVSSLGAYLCVLNAINGNPSLNNTSLLLSENMKILEPDKSESQEYEEHYFHWMKSSDKICEIEI